MSISSMPQPRPVRTTDLEPLLHELGAISRQAEDLQHRIALLQAGLPLVRPGWPMRRVAQVVPVPVKTAEPPPAAPPMAVEDALSQILRVAGDLADLNRALPGPRPEQARAGHLQPPRAPKTHFAAASVSI